MCGGLPKDLAARKVLRVGGVEVVADEPTSEPQTVLVNYDLGMKAVDAGIAVVVPAATIVKKARTPRKIMVAATPDKKPTSEKRKAYLAEKARERRAAEKAGLTVKEYREKFGK